MNSNIKNIFFLTTVLAAVSFQAQAEYRIIFNNSQSKNMIPEQQNVVYSSCKEILDNDSSAASGIYTIKIDEENLEVKCEMELNGGGWTLVAQGSLINDSTLTDAWMTTGWYNKGQQTENIPFKMPDSVINNLKTDNFMGEMNKSGALQIALPEDTCIYDSINDNTADCHIRYNIDGTLQGGDDYDRKASISTGLFGANYNGGVSPTGYNGHSDIYGYFSRMWVR